MRLNNKVILAVVLSIVIVLTATGFGGFLFFNSGINPVQETSEVVRFEVIEGDTLASAATRLKEQGIIKNETVASLFGRYKKLSDLKIGLYDLDKSWDVETILKTLNDPTAAIVDEVLITLREGIWAKEIATLIAAETNVSAQELLTLWNDPIFLEEMIARYAFLDESILDEQARVKLEGYLYPETYYFFKETSARDITLVLLDTHNKIYEQYKDQLAALDMSYHELITLASIVQYESATVDQMRMIAGIFFNRLAVDMKLQSSVTVCYALYEFDSWEACEKNVSVQSPYNTYLYNGLPPGPILNPGKDAIEAVLNPEASDYYYFIADVCGDGSVYYAKTFEEHQANVDKYLTCY